MIRDIQDEIMRLKKENDVCILAHLYQNDAILEVADYTGDSFALAKLAQTVPNKTVLMCGVRFMAETVKMLAPDKRVLLSNPDAGCPMAEQMDREVIQQVKENYPDYTVVAYINTTAELKTVCDVCVTSSSAEKVIRKIDNDKILFIPDCNLGDYVSRQVPEKTFKLLSGGCPTHARLTAGMCRRPRPSIPRGAVFGAPGVRACRCGTGGLCRFYHRHYELCHAERRQRIYHRYGEQYLRAPANAVPGQALLPPVQGLRVPQYEGHHPGRCAGLPARAPPVRRSPCPRRLRKRPCAALTV